MNAIKVKELWAMCGQEMLHDNGDKYILISSDDEGNYFHELFYGFGNCEDADGACIDCTISKEKLKDYVILG